MLSFTWTSQTDNETSVQNLKCLLWMQQHPTDSSLKGLTAAFWSSSEPFPHNIHLHVVLPWCANIPFDVSDVILGMPCCALLLKHPGTHVCCPGGGWMYHPKIYLLVSQFWWVRYQQTARVSRCSMDVDQKRVLVCSIFMLPNNVAHMHMHHLIHKPCRWNIAVLVFEATDARAPVWCVEGL